MNLQIVEFPIHASVENMVDSGLFDIPQIFKNELVPIASNYDHLMDVKVDEHPIENQLKQEIELPSNIQRSDILKNIPSNSIEVASSNYHCQHYVAQVNDNKYKCTHINDITNQTSPDCNQIIQTEGKSFQCSHCESCFSHNDYLDRHLRRHTKENLYHCNHIEKRLVQESYLESHELLKPEEKPCQCNHCGNSTANNFHISDQIIDIYCRVCGKEDKDMTFKPLRYTQRGIFARMYTLLDFRFASFVICNKCPRRIRKHHKPKNRISIVLWDNKMHCPIYYRDKTPYRYSISPIQRLNGNFRKNDEPLADNEVEYPSIIDNSYLIVKNEMDASVNAYDYHTDVKVEEHTLQLQIKQDIEQSSENLVTENLLNISCNSLELDNKCNDYVTGFIQNDYFGKLGKPTEAMLYQCRKCETFLGKPSSYQNQQRIFTGENAYECNNCENNLKIESCVSTPPLDSHCRVCGKKVKDNNSEYSMSTKWGKSKWQDLLAFMYPLLDFHSDTLFICFNCKKRFQKYHLTTFALRKVANKLAIKTKRISIVLWDSEMRCPIYHKNGLPYCFSTSPSQRLNGTFRSSKEPLADNEVCYPEGVDIERAGRDMVKHITIN